MPLLFLEHKTNGCIPHNTILLPGSKRDTGSLLLARTRLRIKLLVAFFTGLFVLTKQLDRDNFG